MARPPPCKQILISARIVANRLLLLLVLFFASLECVANESFDEHRIAVGIKLFRTLVGADLSLEKNISNNDAQIIALVGSHSGSHIERYQEALQSSLSKLDDLNLRVTALPVSQLLKEKGPIAAIFIADHLDRKSVKDIANYAMHKGVISFSPFEGDVELGVLGGISVQATVRPLINVTTLKKSHIAIKPFYLKVAKRYE